MVGIAAITRELTRAGVLAAIAECDRVGRDAFLKMHGFSEAYDYFLLYGGQAYDSKAIAGIAYGDATGHEVRSGDFSGGVRIANRLRELEFEVTGKADWEWDETVLACGLLYENAWREIKEHDPRVSELSTFLRSQWDYAIYVPRFRSTSSVHRKLEDLRTVHPEYARTATRGGGLAPRVVDAFVADPYKMHSLALALRGSGTLARSGEVGDADLNDEDLKRTGMSEFVAAVEGRVLQRLVKVRERNPRLRADKIAQSRRIRGDISCEVCGFDFEATYESLGDGYIQVHHVVPLHFSGETESSLNDLVLLCANCHQMIHRARPVWLTPDELRIVVNHRGGASAASP
ncbi:HNH endonuclease [Rhodococcus qingshengii]|uniref:HNH endonuclease n=1 Tax=Rhodococcus qingshengii TaxID=334542 RepID=UPI0009F6D8B6|nr:HNH endonuclease [Rhodococcus qingshengii]ORC19971.1 hypothetical protein BXO91_23005 [Rhodococcus qingshengii]